MSFFGNLMGSIKDRFISSNAIEDKNLYSYFYISDYIRPSVLRKDGYWLTNDNEFAWICELSPRIRMGSETVETFEQALSKIPESVFSQIILFGSKNIESYLNEYKLMRSQRNNEIVNIVVSNLITFLRQKTNEPINMKFSTQVKNNRVIFVLKNRDINKLTTVKNDVFNILNSNHFYPKTLDEKELKVIFYEMINPSHTLQNIPEYDERKFFNKQIKTNDHKIFVHKDCIVADNKYFKALTLLKLPKFAHISEFGLKLGDYLTKGMDSNQFVDTYMITLNLTRTKDNEMSTIKRAKNIVKGGGNTGNKVKKEKTEIEDIIDGIEERRPMFKVDLNIWVSGKTYEAVKANSDRIKSFWQKKTQKGDNEIGGILLEDFTSAMMPLFIGSLPAGVNDEYFKLITKSKDENHFITEVCQFLPLESDWQGNYPNHFFTSRRGQICGIDMFKSNTAKNAIILAESGGGKSVLANYIVFNEYSRGTKIFIIDIGESYKNLCNEFGGIYISINENSNISFNPFSGLQKTYKEYLQNGDTDTLEEISELIDFLINFVYRLGANLNKDEALKEEKYIRGKLQDMLPILLDTYVYTKIIEIDDIKVFITNNYKQDERLNNFAVHLTSWCKGGLYYKFVCGESTLDLTNPFFVLDLQSVANKPELRDALIYLTTFNISSFIYNSHDRSKKYQVVIDEIHEYLGKSQMMEIFFDQAYRKYRKYNASIIGISQSFADIYDIKTGGLSIAGQAIMTNSPWQFFLNQKETAINAMFQSGLFSFSELEKLLLETTKTEQGFYSEIFLINPNKEKVVLRFILDRYFYYLTSTEPTDKQKIQKIMNTNNCSLSDAIQYIVDNEKKGRE